MKKIIVLGIFCSFSALYFGQNKQKEEFIKNYTYEEIVKSNDSKTIATFLKNNPGHPKSQELKLKLINIINPEAVSDKSYSSLEKKEKTSNTINNSGSKNSKTASILNTLLNEDANGKNAVLLVENKSKCNFTLKFNGLKNYNLDVPARGKNYIEVTKGTYALTANICDAKYTATKNIKNNLSLELNDK
jgi:hypothetical protein